MNPEQNPEPTVQQPTTVQPQQVDPNQKPRLTFLKILLGSALGIINLTALAVVGFVVWFMVEESLHPNPVALAAIVLLPMGGGALVVMSIVDGVYCLKYLLRKSKNKSKRLMATIGLLMCVIILSLVIIVFFANVISIYQLDHPNNAQDGTAAQANMERAASSGYGFDILATSYIPDGYKWSHGEIDEDNGADEIYSDIQYHKPISGIDYEIDVISFSKRDTFHPPTDCGFDLEPYARSPWDRNRTYTCPLVAQTDSGRPVYHYEGPFGDSGKPPTSEAYYMEYGRDEVIVFFIKDPQEPTQTEVLQMMNSLTIIGVDTLVKNNTASRGFEL